MKEGLLRHQISLRGQTVVSGVSKPMGDAFRSTLKPYLRRMTSDEEMPSGNERTHFREEVNHKISPNWVTGLIIFWSNEAGPTDFRQRVCT